MKQIKTSREPDSRNTRTTLLGAGLAEKLKLFTAITAVLFNRS